MVSHGFYLLFVSSVSLFILCFTPVCLCFPQSFIYFFHLSLVGCSVCLPLSAQLDSVSLETSSSSLRLQVSPLQPAGYFHSFLVIFPLLVFFLYLPVSYKIFVQLIILQLPEAEENKVFFRHCLSLP